MSRIHQALSRAGQEIKESVIAGSVPPPAGMDVMPEASDAPDVPDMFKLPTTKKEHRPPEKIYYQPRPEHRFVIKEPRFRIAAEAFRLLRLRLERIREKKQMSSLLISSSIPREGKSMVALNLAAALALTSARVLLVDGDLRKPSLAMMLGLRSHPGLTGFLEGGCDFEGSLCQIDPIGIYFVPGGNLINNPVEQVQSLRMRKFLSEATSTFDWVIVDSTPVLPFPESICLASLCDATLMVSRENVTTEEDYKRSLEALKGTNVVAGVLNAAEPIPSDQYYYAYPTAASRTPQILSSINSIATAKAES